NPFHLLIIVCCQLADHFCRSAESECMRRNFFTRRHKTTSANKGMLTNLCTVKNNRAHTDQCVLSNCGRMQCYLMSDRDIIFDDDGSSWTLMAQRKILDIHPFTDCRRCNICGDNRLKPNTRLVSSPNIEDAGSDCRDESNTR